MQKAAIPVNEDARICAVQDLKILDTKTEERFDRLTKEATVRFSVPMSTITVVDRSREWFKSEQGIGKREGPRDISFCGHALLSQDILIIEDTSLDSRFADNPMVIGAPFVRFYAGKSLYEYKSNLPVGVFCIKDIKPKKMTPDDISDFLELAKKAEVELNKVI